MQDINTLVSRIPANESVTGAVIEKLPVTKANVQKFIENFLTSRSKNPNTTLYLIADSTVVTYATKKYRDAWQELTIDQLAKFST